MADNVTLLPGGGGATIRTFSDGTNEWPGGVDSYVTGGSAGAWTIQYVELAHGLPVQPGTSTTWAATQSGTWNINNVSGTITLPTGASTSAKQPAIGVSGTASADVITIQGISGMTAVKVDGSAVTQPISVASVPSHDVTNAGTFAVQAAQSGTWNIGTVTTLTGITNVVHIDDNSGSITVDGTVAATQSGTWNVGTVTTLTGITNVVHVDDNSGSLTVDGTVAATQSGTWTVQPGNTANTTPWLVQDSPATSGGLSFAHVTSAASNNKTQVKSSAGQVYTIMAQNSNASIRYLKVFNNTSAGVTMGTTAADYQFMIPGNTAGAGLVINIDKGIAHSTGITIAITGGVSLTDNTSISANDVTLTITYK